MDPGGAELAVPTPAPAPVPAPEHEPAPASAVPLALGASSMEQRHGLQLLRSRGRIRGVFALLGPAFVAAVAYIDPGNFATNIAGGAKYGFLLGWVILMANLMAM